MSGFTGCNNQILVKFQHIRQIPLELYFPGLVIIQYYTNVLLWKLLKNDLIVIGAEQLLAEVSIKFYGRHPHHMQEEAS